MSNDLISVEKISATKKNVLHAHHHNNVIYQFLCHCNSWYVGRTFHRLHERIKQHVSGSIRNHYSSQDRSNLSRARKKNSTYQIIVRDSAIGRHLLKNPSYASQYSDNQFSGLARGRTSFRLSALETTFIKSFQPNLCRHKEFLYNLKLFINALLLSLLIGCLS